MDQNLRPRYQCVLTKRGRMDHLTLVVEHAPGRTEEEIIYSQVNLRKMIKDRMGVTVDVDIVDKVDSGEGKAKRIVDNR